MSDVDGLFDESFGSMNRSFDPDFFENELDLTKDFEETEIKLKEPDHDLKPWKCTECNSGN